MIFVTVGTHEQQFNRLIKEIDELKKQGKLQEDVFIQTGYSDYEPSCCEWKKLLPYSEMAEKIEKARIVVTHGGPSSFIAVLQAGKIPVVVPRKADFQEHVNNHQADFVKMVSERQKNIIPVYEVEKLGDVLAGYEEIVGKMPLQNQSNNKIFNEQLEAIVKKMFGED